MQRRIAVSLAAVLILGVVLSDPTPARSISKAEVEQACAASREALEAYREVRDETEAVTTELNTVRGRIDTVATTELTLRAQVDEYEREILEMRDSVLDRAVDLYMAGGQSFTSVFFAANDVSQVIAGQEMLAAATEEDVGSIDRLNALATNTNSLQGELRDARGELRELETDIEGESDRLTELLAEADERRAALSSDCANAQAEYERQIARQRAAEAARRGSAAGGLPAAATPGFLCPFQGSGFSFINDWGFPRSGGRTHKGTDLFAAMGKSMVAVADGTIRTRIGGLGGTTVWLMSDYGVDYYYAHLSAYGPGIQTGARVSRGDVVGYNGDTGNARGQPQLHFGVWTTNWVNPYPTLARSC